MKNKQTNKKYWSYKQNKMEQKTKGNNVSALKICKFRPVVEPVSYFAKFDPWLAYFYDPNPLNQLFEVNLIHES